MIIEVKVIPNASKDEVVEDKGNRLKVKCRAVPEKGKANEAVIAILSGHYGVPKRNIRIIRGLSSSRKLIEVL